jgi:NDP-sugar pyrophosphorylase family protein
MEGNVIAIVLAAGQGTRLAPFTHHRPKPLLPLFDLPLIGLTSRMLLVAGIDEIVVNTFHLAEMLEAYIDDRLEGVLTEPLDAIREEERATARVARFHISSEEELMGTGGGIAQARPFFRDRTLLVVNSDVILDYDLEALVQEHQVSGADATLLLHDGRGFEHLRSTALDDRGRVVDIRPVSSADPDRGVFSGVYVLEPSVYDLLPKEPCSVIERGFLPALRKGLTVRGLKAHFSWYDLGTWPAYHAACMELLETISHGRPEVGLAGLVKEMAPGRFLKLGESMKWVRGTIVGPCYHSPCTDVGEGAVVGPYAVLSERTSVADGCRITRSVLLPDAHASGDLDGETLLGPQ